MAIDTENKRRSALSYGGPITYPRPHGAIGAADREHAAWLYAGITANAPVTNVAQRSSISISMGIQIGVLLAIAALKGGPTR